MKEEKKWEKKEGMNKQEREETKRKNKFPQGSLIFWLVQQECYQIVDLTGILRFLVSWTSPAELTEGGKEVLSAEWEWASEYIHNSPEDRGKGSSDCRVPDSASASCKQDIRIAVLSNTHLAWNEL